MSSNYDQYIHDHVYFVNKAFDWIVQHFSDVADKLAKEYIVALPRHDESKWSEEEYKAYDNYFYGNRSYKVVNDFNYAWLHHIHNNPHHWQYWVLQHDDKSEEVLEMPYRYVIEMICDWWSFSFKSGNLYEIFDWYDKHKGMKLHPDTRKLVEDILDSIKGELDKETFDKSLEHHGIKGQRWGVRNGPPYPINGYSSTNELSQNMKSFSYKEFDRLMSADEVGKRKTGSCHDQVMYEFQQLRRMGKKPNGLFIMEYDDSNQGGMTHSLVYYTENNKAHWFENAWTERAGDTEYESIESIKKEIEKAHRNGEFGNHKRFKNIIFGEFNESDHEIGEDLQTLVDKCLENS